MQSSDYSKSQNGFILIHLILVVMFLSGATLLFGSFVNQYARKVETAITQLQKQLQYRSATYRAISILAQDDPRVDHLAEKWGQQDLSFFANESEIQFSIEDECGKLDVNQLFSKESEKRDQYEYFIQSVLQKIGLTRFKAGQFVGILNRFAPFHDLAQIDLICAELGIKSNDIRKCLTIYSHGKININTAPSEVLEVLLEDKGSILIKDILKLRSRRPYLNVQGREFQDVRLDSLKFLTTRSSFFLIYTQDNNFKTKRRITAVIERSLGELKVRQWTEE